MPRRGPQEVAAMLATAAHQSSSTSRVTTWRRMAPAAPLRLLFAVVLLSLAAAADASVVWVRGDCTSSLAAPLCAPTDKR